jgi:arylsulfatase
MCRSLLVGLFCGLVLSCPLLADAPRRPNVILIVADDLGYAEVGCYGQKKIQTPQLDRMAREGMRFTQFYAGSPVCAPSRCCLMTGKHGGHAWVRTNLAVKPEGQTPVPTGEVMLPELVRKEGYAQGAIGKWGLGPPASEADPIKRGFDLFYGYDCQGHAHSHFPTYLWRNDRHEKLPGNDGKKGTTHSHELFEKEALAFIRTNKSRPFFLYLPFTIPHVALQAPDEWLAPYKGKWPDPAYDGKKGYLPHPSPRAAYAGMVTRMDGTVGKILDLLVNLKLGQDTLVMFTSDNGPTHNVGGADSTFFDSAGPLRGLKGSVYEGGIRVPLIAWRPNTIPAGKVSDHVACFPDFLPTVMDTIGARGRIPGRLDGISFLPSMQGLPDVQKKHAHLVWEFAGYGGQQAVRAGDWKGVRRGLMKGPARLELYDLSKDIGEKEDVAGTHPEVVRKLEGILAREHTPSKLFPLKGLGDR